MEPSTKLPKNKWDFFLAHAHTDKAFAKELYECMIKNSRSAFLDQSCIEPGTYWDQVIPQAQENSWMTVALISANIGEAHFAREEVQTGIHLARKNPSRHRIVPVYVNGASDDLSNLVYGLRLVQGIHIASTDNVENLVSRLDDILKVLKNGDQPSIAPARNDIHILHAYPTGPLVPPEMISRTIIESYSRLIRQSEAKLIVSEANAFRIEADPGVTYIIHLHKATPPDKVSAFDFWMEIFDYARLQGPRMLAALLLTIPDDQFDTRAKIARTKLLAQLRNHY